MKVSFILPIYNVEKYLSECVESILVQTYRDFEILLVDDGSPDNCPALCDEWAKKDSRIKALHKPNGGLSDARNYGLKHAQGDYVVFVDSDDFWVNKDCLENLMNVVDVHPECDFIGFNCSYYYSDTKTFKKWVAYDESLSKPTDKDTVLCSLVASGTFPMSACLKIIKRKSLSEINLHFIKGLLSEDIPWFINLLEGAKKCMFINDYIYAYRQGVVGSISNSFSVRNFNSILRIIDNELQKLEGRTFNEKTKDYIKSFLAYELCICLGGLGQLEKSVRNEYYEKLKPYKWLLKFCQNPKVKKVSILNSLVGFRLTRFFLEFYFSRR
ncbi:glycosyltransferase family 2 protein [Phocaeicola coprocola]|uniref:glycosyltransferase family 2 protein n=1 Tax=Phocaeicola coprocola TaxID=310298 RepID=UPI00294261FC|nr:glycosyltransferase family 2 protein [Phocaeicola coprocola]